MQSCFSVIDLVGGKRGRDNALKPKAVYEKYIYWVSQKEESRLREDLADQGIRLKSAKGVVCTPLDEINRIASVAPEVWDDTCGRQGSWYRQSEKNGLFLIVSSFPVEGCEGRKAGRITRSDFRPPRYATPEEMEAMVNEQAFSGQMPQRWSEADDMEQRIQLRWARRLGAEDPEYPALFRVHTANHANFLRPRLTVQENGLVVPYSIAPSAQLCSCCLELFQVLGADYLRKYVAPCPGAAIFARLEPDVFLQVEAPGDPSARKNV
jgi:hypothetical protein